MWLGQMENFKWVILECLAQPAHPIEKERFDADGHPERAQYVVHCPLESWRVYGFIDDTAVRTCRPGSGQFGPVEGPECPRRNHAYDIQRTFYRYVISFIIDIFKVLVYLINNIHFYFTVGI